MTLVAVLPSLQAWQARGGAWAENDASFSGDEVAYCAYVNALLDGRPRRNDPYTGRDGGAQPESLFSIQFLPPYAIAGAARLLRLTAPQVFLALNFVVPFLTALALFCLLKAVAQDDAGAAAGAVFVLCLGTYGALYGPLRALFGIDTIYTFAHLPFMRRYVPALPFPVFWAFGACVWQALANADGGWRMADGKTKTTRLPLLYAALAGALFAVLVFSYFYLWTAALAWFALWAALCWLARPAQRARMRGPLLIILVMMLAALLPYGLLVARRAATMDTVQLLALSRAPDFARSSVKASLLLLCGLGWGVWRGRLAWREPRFLFALACALTPLAIFNQQIVTGRSLQPLHYEMYLTKYLFLLALWLTVKMLWPNLSRRALAVITIVALGWGIIETTISTQRYLRNYPQANAVGPVARRIHERLPSEPRAGPATVFYAYLADADAAPTHAPEAVLWAPHLPAFASVSAAENKERIYQFMYYAGVTLDGVDEHNFNASDQAYLLHSLIEWALNEPAWTVNWQPLAPEKARAEIAAYRSYARNFNREQAARLPLAYVVVNNYAPVNLTNLKRWHTLDAGEQQGAFTVYQVRLKP